MKNRNIAVAIILSIITCGLYDIYWFICLTNDSNQMSDTDKTASGGVAFILSIITCGIYGLYWAYKLGKKVGDSGILYLLLNFIALGWVDNILAQSKINNYVMKNQQTNA